MQACDGPDGQLFRRFPDKIKIGVMGIAITSITIWPRRHRLAASLFQHEMLYKTGIDGCCLLSYTNELQQ
jgi:hypothetical protein